MIKGRTSETSSQNSVRSDIFIDHRRPKKLFHCFRAHDHERRRVPTSVSGLLVMSARKQLYTFAPCFQTTSVPIVLIGEDRQIHPKIIAAVFIFWLLVVLVFDPYYITYIRCRFRSQQYYSYVAAACDKLIQDAHGEDKRLR